MRVCITLRIIRMLTWGIIKLAGEPTYEHVTYFYGFKKRTVEIIIKKK
ncbi:Uncharacterised protein [Myroides odoratus]|uniref:Uncharacterized protein n=1 Tax=Myroides odoratus TaxID=256 RepID=A0A378RNT5_MYROD|nr:Uncharacterised protein [Myroides odoratus]